jgi:hypothetical protein
MNDKTKAFQEKLSELSSDEGFKEGMRHQVWAPLVPQAIICHEVSSTQISKNLSQDLDVSFDAEPRKKTTRLGVLVDCVILAIRDNCKLGYFIHSNFELETFDNIITRKTTYRINWIASMPLEKSLKTS